MFTRNPSVLKRSFRRAILQGFLFLGIWLLDFQFWSLSVTLMPLQAFLQGEGRYRFLALRLIYLKHVTGDFELWGEKGESLDFIGLTWWDFSNFNGKKKAVIKFLNSPSLVCGAARYCQNITKTKLKGFKIHFWIDRLKAYIFLDHLVDEKSKLCGAMLYRFINEKSLQTTRIKSSH